MPAIWLRAASSTVASPVTVTAVSTPPTVDETGTSKAAPTVSLERADAVREPLDGVPSTSYGPTLRYGKRKRPSASVVASAVTLVSVCRALTCAPGTTAPWDR